MQKRALPSSLRPSSAKAISWLVFAVVALFIAAQPSSAVARESEAKALALTSAANPQKIVCRSQEEALQLGNTYAVSQNGQLIITSGTPSMLPLIHGKAYVVVRKVPYDTITKGDLLVYMGRPSANRRDRISMLHRTVQHDSGGWLMCGDNNARTESWDRVTPANYLGTVTMIIEFPQA